MKQLGRFTFPETSDEVREWVVRTRVHALASTALAVAHTRIEGAWCAYCMGVPGINHNDEYEKVLKQGDKLSEEIARLIFPEFDDVPYAR